VEVAKSTSTCRQPELVDGKKKEISREKINRTKKNKLSKLKSGIHMFTYLGNVLGRNLLEKAQPEGIQITNISIK